jgi:pimeloyl-ACP methyl ester carboxylesterase
MIEKFGGPAWVEMCISGWANKPTLSAESVEVYKQHFTKKSVIDASCADYRAAAHIDAPLEAKDHEEGKRIGIPILVLYSKTYLGSRYDVPAVWKEFMSDKASLTTYGFDDIGHFCFEEDAEGSYKAITQWIAEVLQVRV